MQGASPQRSDYISEKPIYSTRIRFLSLIDICIHYLINHPVIPVTTLPLEVQEHIERRKADDMYRVLPEYSFEKYEIILRNIQGYLDSVSSTNGKDNKINIAIDMLRSLDEHLYHLRYVNVHAKGIQQKLIDLPSDGFPIAVSQHYLMKWFDYKLALPPSPPPQS